MYNNFLIAGELGSQFQLCIFLSMILLLIGKVSVAPIAPWIIHRWTEIELILDFIESVKFLEIANIILLIEYHRK